MPKNTSGLVATIQPNTFCFNFTSLVGQTNHFGIVRTMQCSPQTLYSRIFWGHPLDLSGISMESSSHCWYWQILLVCWGDLQGVWGGTFGSLLLTIPRVLPGLWKGSHPNGTCVLHLLFGKVHTLWFFWLQNLLYFFQSLCSHTIHRPCVLGSHWKKSVAVFRHVQT